MIDAGGFEVKVYPLTISEHPDADRLEIARIGDTEYVSIVAKGAYTTGDTAAYIPEGSVVPYAVQEKLGLVGRLAGSKKDRVKAVRLRGVFSQGLVYPTNHPVGTDIAEELGVTKYEPPIPAQFAGTHYQAFGKTLHFDIENIKKWPHVLQPGERVVITEKLHGTWCSLGMFEGEPIVSSKGLSKAGIALKIDDPKNNNNTYIRIYRNYEGVLQELRKSLGDTFYVVGEVFGRGIQDLDYGMAKPTFMPFDIYVGRPGQGRYMSFHEMDKELVTWYVVCVPLLYDGPYDPDALADITKGTSTLADHIREGVVVKAEPSKYYENGRVQFKSISEDYLVRKGGTEFN